MQNSDDLLPLIQRELQLIKPGIELVSTNTDLIADLGLDSVQVLEMCTALEDELDVSIPVNRLGDVRTIGQLIAVLEGIISS